MSNSSSVRVPIWHDTTISSVTSSTGARDMRHNPKSVLAALEIPLFRPEWPWAAPGRATACCESRFGSFPRPEGHAQTIFTGAEVSPAVSFHSIGHLLPLLYSPLRRMRSEEHT